MAVRAATPESEIYRLVDDLAPVAGPTLDATTFGKWTPELAARVGDGGRLLLAGVSTDCCVLSTALAAADAGVEVQIVADACAGVSDAAHQRALDVMRLYGPHIQVVTLADVLGQDAEIPSRYEAPRDAGPRPATPMAPEERTSP